MKVDVLIKMIKLLPKTSAEAITSQDLVEKYFKQSGDEGPDRATHNTFIRRQLDEMEELSMLEFIANDDKKKRIKRSERYYLKDNSVVRHFMNSRVALDLIWSQNVMRLLRPIAKGDDIKDIAKEARLNAQEKTLSQRVRLVQDSIGRKDAHIDPEVLATCLSAINTNNCVTLRYYDRQRRVIDDISNRCERTLLGLVAKDGTIYAITCLGADDAPVHIAMQRIEEAREVHTRGYARPDFDIDKYVNEQHQLAHVLKEYPEPVLMVLKVAPEAIFHFRERPILSIYGEQKIEEPNGIDERYTVSVKVPITVQLPPFLWSHACWVEVVSPPALRKRVGERLLAAASHYAKDVKPKFGPD